jgi:hypothetical protein
VILLFLTWNDNQGRVITPAFPMILVRKFKIKTPFDLSKACWWVAVKMLNKPSLKKRNWWLQLHFTERSTSFSKVWFQLTFCLSSLGSFKIFLGKVIDRLNPFTCTSMSKGLANFCKIFGTFIDQWNHFTCKSMESHISIQVLFAISTTIFD